MEFARELSFEGCFNFRDLGGYPTRDGRWVRPRRLFRADGPHALTEGDTAALRALELACVIDLRTEGEVVARGSYVTVLESVIGYHLPLTDVLPDATELPTWIDPKVVARRYRAMLDAATDVIAEVLAILSDPSAYPAVFHCSAGKDRTGILAAVLLGVLGVPDEMIVADYARSAEAMGRLIAHLRTVHPDATEQLDQLAPAMIAAQPDAMAAFIRRLRADFGSFDDYATTIGVGSAPRYLRAALLI
jgi:protein-tyrosine phosphatase